MNKGQFLSSLLNSPTVGTAVLTIAVQQPDVLNPTLVGEGYGERFKFALDDAHFELATYNLLPSARAFIEERAAGKPVRLPKEIAPIYPDYTAIRFLDEFLDFDDMYKKLTVNGKRVIWLSLAEMEDAQANLNTKAVSLGYAYNPDGTTSSHVYLYDEYVQIVTESSSSSYCFERFNDNNYAMSVTE